VHVNGDLVIHNGSNTVFDICFAWDFNISL